MESSTVYGTRLPYLRQHEKVIGPNPRALVVDKGEAVDINDYQDLRVAETLLNLRRTPST